MSTLLVVKTEVLITAHDTATNTLVKMWYFQGKEGKQTPSSRKHKNQEF